MFKKFIISLPFVKKEITDIADTATRLALDIELSKRKQEYDTLKIRCKTAQEAEDMIFRKYTTALDDLSQKAVQIHQLTTTLDNIVDYLIPEKEQPSPLEYKDIPQLIINKCSQKTKSKKPKSKAKKTK